MALLTEWQNIRDAYEVERFLGAGAFAEVYRVKHRFLGRQALKIFKAPGMTFEQTHELLGEAALLSQLGHPNIVRVFDADVLESEHGARGYFTMEYVAGGTLEKFWRSHGTRFVPTQTAVDLIMQVCRGLEVAHAASPPIIHRDIKPQNILVGYDAQGLRAKVSDFGLARRVNPLTLEATAKGTRGFKAPEALLGTKKDSLQGDVWAVGSILHLLLTDRLPFLGKETGKQTGKAVEQDFSKPLASVSAHNPGVDNALSNIVLKALAIRQSDRYRNAGEIADALRSWVNITDGERPKMGLAESTESKDVHGNAPSAFDAAQAEKMAQKAIENARVPGKLRDAADMMEEAFNLAPTLRPSYEYQLKLWRRGVVM